MKLALPALLVIASAASCASPLVASSEDADAATLDATTLDAAPADGAADTGDSSADSSADTLDAGPPTEGDADATPPVDVGPPAEGEVEIWFWNLWNNGLGPDNRSLVVEWAPPNIFFSDSFEEDNHTLLQAEAGYPYGFHSGENFAFSGQLPCGDVEVIHHDDITKRLLRCELPLGDEVIDVFEIHLKNPTKSTAAEETQAAEVLQVIAEVGARTGHVATVLIGDFNSRSPLDGETELIAGAQSFLDAGYTDTWKLLHPDDFEPTKIARSFEGSRIDYAFVSGDLVDQVVASGIQIDGVTYPEYSDHRPVWVRLAPKP